MTEGAEVAIHNAPRSSGLLSPADVLAQVATIRQIMAEVMRDGEHYGKVPGCGPKAVLLQPGAQILALTFRLGPKFKVQQTEIDGGHREFYVETELVNLTTGQLVGMGVGMSSTLETKWRYRSGPVEFTGKPVPAGYWDLRSTEPAKATEMLGGRGHQVRKNPDTKGWEIVVAGERVETDNPADTFNTALKMASKRSFVHAVLNTTAASEMFTTHDEADTVQAPDPRVDGVALARLRARRDELGVAPELYAKQLAHYGVTVDASLSTEAALNLLAAYDAREGAS